MKRRSFLLGVAALPVAAHAAWAVDEGSPVAPGQWTEPDWFADPGWIRERVDDESVQIVALTPPNEFAQGHIPGASQIDWPDLALTDSASATIETWQAVVAQQLADRAIQPDSTVAIYDGGTFYAARLWWILHVMGHRNKRILDGGLPAWREADGQIATGEATTGRGMQPYPGEPNLDVLASVELVQVAAAAGSHVLVDARSTEEFAKGHIPGAVNMPFTENAVPDSGGRWKDPDDLRAMYERVGVTSGSPVIPYCSTGVRSANTWFTLSALGYSGVRLFSGSFAEWTSDPARPVEVGI